MYPLRHVILIILINEQSLKGKIKEKVKTRCHAIAGSTARCGCNFGTYRSFQWHRAVFSAV